ncbi:MAG: N-acetyltransferase [Acidimicrobiaceae bacterium]|nr:N-acetyltransferase [Acidimicrobiaceae bacterium]MBO0748679.1 N-acetyltransferase [Acidimicrobiaceae bacterium]
MSDDTGKTEVVKDEGRRRYAILVDGKAAGVADYLEQGETVELPHTYVDPARRGQGLAGILIRHAVDDVVASGRKVIPTCPYVQAWLDSHPDYADCVAD